MSKYRKTIVVVVGAAFTWAVSAYATNPNVSHWLGLVGAILTAAGVFQVPNAEPPYVDGGMPKDT